MTLLFGEIFTALNPFGKCCIIFAEKKAVPYIHAHRIYEPRLALSQRWADGEKRSDSISATESVMRRPPHEKSPYPHPFCTVAKQIQSVVSIEMRDFGGGAVFTADTAEDADDDSVFCEGCGGS
jgi:hypothetical protein